MATYTVVARDKNSWTVNSDGSHTYAVTWDCGHKHLTPMAAYQCWLSMGDAACSYHATVEASAGDNPSMEDLAAEHHRQQT